MLRTKVSNLADISELTWIKPSQFIDHARLSGDYANMLDNDTIDSDRSDYTEDENMMVMYLENTISIVEKYLPFDLRAKDYETFYPPYIKTQLRKYIEDDSLTVKFNDITLTDDDYKLVDDMLYLKSIDDYGDNCGGSHLKVTYRVENFDVANNPDIKQAILEVFTYLNENKGDCVGELCGCGSAKRLLEDYLPILV